MSVCTDGTEHRPAKMNADDTHFFCTKCGRQIENPGDELAPAPAPEIPETPAPAPVAPKTTAPWNFQ